MIISQIPSDARSDQWVLKAILPITKQEVIMKFKLNFNMDNAAFIHAATEIYIILEQVIEAVRSGHTDRAIIDSNGNKVGSWEIIE